MPLGSAALAGTNFPIDRHHTAKLLGFPAVTHNSMDAVSDRDFIVEFCSAASILMMHLSRFCEEIILWSTSECALMELSDAFTTGSSIMPQKKNPDAAELIRGKTGRIYGNLIGLLTMMKGQPLAYNKDLQEDKEPLFDTVDTVRTSLEVFSGMLKTAKFKKLNSEELAASGFLTATDLADYLVLQNVPFREAHEITGKTVAYCIDDRQDARAVDAGGASEDIKEDQKGCVRLPVRGAVGETEKCVWRHRAQPGEGTTRAAIQKLEMMTLMKKWLPYILIAVDPSA